MSRKKNEYDIVKKQKKYSYNAMIHKKFFKLNYLNIVKLAYNLLKIYRLS